MKKILQLVALVFITNSFAQSNSNNFDWSFNIGSGSNNVQKLHYNSNGDLLFLAVVNGQGTFGGVTVASTKIGGNPGATTFIGKRTQAGVKTVVLKIAGSYPLAGIDDFVIDSNDNIIVSGYAVGYSATDNYNFGNGVLLYGNGNYVAKFSPTGVCQWAKLVNYGIPSLTFYVNATIALGVLPTNEIYFAGKSNEGNKPFWLMKIDTNGNEVWHKEWILPTLSSVSLFTSKSGNFFDNTGKAYFILYNYATSPNLTLDGVTLTAPAGTHPVVSSLLTINNDGTNGTFSTYRGGLTDLAVERATGNAILQWNQFSANPAPFNNIPASQTNGYNGFVGMDSSRNFLGCTTDFYTAQASTLSGIIPLGNLKFVGSDIIYAGIPITAGTQSYTSTNKTFVWRFYENFTIAKYVAHPDLRGSTPVANIIPLIAQFGNKIAVTGSYLKADNPTITINGTTLTACENDLTFSTTFPAYAPTTKDVFISQLTIGNSLSLIDNEIAKFKIYPNPSSRNINLSFENNLEKANLKIISILGQTVLEKQNISGNNISLDVSGLSNGTYVVQLQEGSSISTSKFIKQ
ncbi:T9SS type A sorting domain-containing protein [Flavobacterium sp.]|uniref:T9SS type A sorting domain-containing protein n=1 Tax=Flavobacterium sp. TaxID=239 RepID=UPI00286E619B|nr:T9SS type A sorting domain-containing protein [Flavobacterium sp.]